MQKVRQGNETYSDKSLKINHSNQLWKLIPTVSVKAQNGRNLNLKTDSLRKNLLTINDATTSTKTRSNWEVYANFFHLNHLVWKSIEHQVQKLFAYQKARFLSCLRPETLSQTTAGPPLNRCNNWIYHI